MANAEDRIDFLVQKRFNDTELAVDKLSEGMPTIEKKIFSELISLLKDLDIKDGKIKNTTANVKFIKTVVKKKLNDIVKNPKYIQSVTEFAGNIGSLSKSVDTQANIQKSIVE